MTQKRVAVFGASGFVGSSVATALESRGALVLRISAPRLDPIDPSSVDSLFLDSCESRSELGVALADVDSVVNAAGIPDASCRDVAALTAANAACAAVLASVARDCGIQRFVHVSSAVVQGGVAVLDASNDLAPFSPYSESKALGEMLVAKFGPKEHVVYRPPSVHGSDRRVTRMIRRIASSPVMSTTVAPGDAPSPQALIQNVGDAIAFLALHDFAPPPIVIHPSEGITTASLLRILGKREPRLVPRWVGVPLLTLLRGCAIALPALRANARRIELLWLGQAQVASWLTEVGWTPPAGVECWEALADHTAG